MATTQTDFDPFTQQITILLPDQTPMNITIDDIQEIVSYAAQVSINYGSQIGASLILLVIALLVSKIEKWRSINFILNTLALLLDFIRSVIISLYCTGPWWNWYSVLSGDFDNVPDSAYATSVAGTVLTFLLVLCLQASLINQVYVVCATARTLYKTCIMITTGIVALVVTGFQFANTILTAREALVQEVGPWDDRIASATTITLTIGICFFSLVFVLKLAYQIRERHRLGLKQFGPMQILVVMGCQTLIVPVIFCGIQYKINLIPQASSLVPTTVALFLPLSALWASVTVDENMRGNSDRKNHHYLPGSWGSGSTANTPLFRQNRLDSVKSMKTDKPASFDAPQARPDSCLTYGKDDFEKQMRNGHRFDTIELEG
ncbi:hypothetical protein EV356DRAFT_573657 [Viridothelium virens]|uniref:Pheromone alpha factor receptor n=1 Tax=Viridothelium virens TaxID=1048519 RepID=A0A6A6HKL5_VIRVR|nr:hypothetical protein EV356DRAFT_573657 [Viridothelium virens]